MAKEPVPGNREGSLEAPTRLPLEWRAAEFYDAALIECDDD